MVVWQIFVRCSFCCGVRSFVPYNISWRFTLRETTKTKNSKEKGKYVRTWNDRAENVCFSSHVEYMCDGYYMVESERTAPQFLFAQKSSLETHSLVATIDALAKKKNTEKHIPFDTSISEHLIEAHTHTTHAHEGIRAKPTTNKIHKKKTNEVLFLFKHTIWPVNSYA